MEDIKSIVSRKSASHIKYIPFIEKLSETIDVKYFKYLNDNVDRNEVINKLNNITNNIEYAIGVEAGIYEWTIVYIFTNNYPTSYITGVYQEKVSNMIFDLDNIIKNNKELLDECQTIAFLDPSVINVDNWKYVKRRIDLREAKKNNITATDLYKCKKCGERKCTVYQVQTRSADEPMTLFITCLVCYNEFKK